LLFQCTSDYRIHGMATSGECASVHDQARNLQ